MDVNISVQAKLTSTGGYRSPSFTRFCILFFVAGLLLNPLQASAACDEEIQPAFPSFSHIIVVGSCANEAEAQQGCVALAQSHGSTIGQCSRFANQPTVGAGYFREQYPDGSYSSWYAGHYSWWPEDENAMPRRNVGPPPCPDQCFGDPINAGNGNKFETVAEFKGGEESPLEFSWTYNSLSDINLFPLSLFVLGRNRSHYYSRGISYFEAASAVPTAYLLRPNGKILRFRKIGSAWVGDSGEPGMLQALEVGGSIQGWLYFDNQGGREEFDENGRVLRLIDRDGRKQQLIYNASGAVASVLDDSSRALTFTYNTAGLLQELETPDGSIISFVYSSANDLAHVNYPDQTSITYLYDEAAHSQAVAFGALTGVIDENGVRRSTTTYDYYHRATSTTLSGSIGGYSASYVFSQNRSYGTHATVMLPAGGMREADFTSIAGMILPVSIAESCPDCIASEKSYTYDQNGYLDTVTVNGVTEDLDYNDRGLIEQRIEAKETASQRTVQTDWHANFRVPTERRAYDGSNFLISESTWTYNARGQVLTHTTTYPGASTSRTVSTTYCEQVDIDVGTCPLQGLLTAVDGPRTDINDVISYTYRMVDEASCVSSPACPYRKGDLWKVTNSIGQVTETLAYDGTGRVLSIKDPNGVITDFEYHPRGWLTARKVRGTDDAVETDDRITRIEYWPTGLVKKVTQPDGSFTAYTYDAAHRLTDIADNAGNTIHYTLDNAGNRVQEDTKDAGGALKRTLSRIYNQLGQISTRADADANPTDLTYDANGNLDTVTDAYGRVTNQDYDPLNRLVRTLQDVGGIEAETEFEYDALDRLTKVIDPKGLATTYTYNGFGDLTQLFSPDTRTTTYTYDSAGNRASATDPSGRRTDYSYDALNRLTGIDYPYAAQDVSFVYDVVPLVCGAGETYAVGRLSQMTDNSGSTDYCYDRFGNLVRKVQATNNQTFILRYAYTKAGQLQSLVYPDGAVVDYVRDAQGRVTEVGVTAPGDVRRVLVNQVAWYPFGPAAGWVYGNGRSLERTYNLNYQPETVLDGNSGGLSLGYGFDAVGNLTQLSDGFHSTLLARYDYDALGRLSATRDGPTGTVIEAYGYDATGNRTSLTNAGGTTAYVYDADKHRLRKVGGATRWYDISGNTLSIGGAAREFAYNVAGRMKLAKRNSVTVMQYAYNGKGERVRKYLGTSNTYTVYDEAGRWLGDYDSSGAPIQQAIWLDSLPVGLLVGAGSSQRLHYVEPDHLGTPRVVIDPVRDVAVWAWDAKGEAFGNTIPDQDPDGDGIALVFDMRFPGQRYDAASGLNYNYHRNYEAETGRYTRPDPIGLNGGISMFSYANASPLKNVDPNGLMWFGPTCDAAQRAFITSQVIQLANDISSKASKGKDQCKEGNCDFELAADVMRWIAHKAYFSCDRSGPCAEVVGPYVYLYPPYIGAPDSSQISSPGTCGCFRSALFHEAAHAVRLSESEDNIRRETLSCVPCGTNVSESGGPL